MSALKSLTFIFLGHILGHAHAVCLNGHPTVENEFQRSDDVVVARVLDSVAIRDPEEPDMVGRYRYNLHIQRSFKGRPAGRDIVIFSENTSSRFPMDVGEEYLLFIRQWSEGDAVDACGNSSLLSKGGPALSLIPGGTN